LNKKQGGCPWSFFNTRGLEALDQGFLKTFNLAVLPGGISTGRDLDDVEEF